MTQRTPQARSAAGARQAEALAIAIPGDPRTPVETSWRDFVFSEVWTRPGLDRRARFVIAIAGAANAIGPRRILESYIRGALTLGELTLVELREIALHMTAYAGWSQAAGLDDAVTRVAEELGLEPVDLAPLRSKSWTEEERFADGEASFHKVMTSGGPAPVTAFFETGIVNYVFAELWTRDALDQRSRRLVTLVGAADSQAPQAVRSHAYSAMASGDLTKDEMFEFVMQYAIHGGHTRASTMQALVFEMAEAIEKGLPFTR
jgi:4-carboxymuconolactone decarboxylase